MKKLHSLLIVIVLLLTVRQQASAQIYGQARIDSLEHILTKVKEHAEKVNILNALSHEYFQKDKLILSDSLAQLALVVSTENQFSSGKADALKNIGLVLNSLGKYQDPLKNFHTCLIIYKSLGDKKGMATTYLAIANVYVAGKDYVKAQENFSTSLEMAEASGEKDIIARIYNDMGNMNLQEGKYPEAISFYTRALNTYKETGNLYGIVAVYKNIGWTRFNQGLDSVSMRVYSLALKNALIMGDKLIIGKLYGQMGWLSESMGDFSGALRNYSDALAVFKKMGDLEKIALIHASVGNIYVIRGNYPMALETFFQELKALEKTNDKKGIAMTYTSIGNVYLLQKEYPKALKYFFEQLNLAKEINDNINEGYAYLNIGETYYYQRKYADALEYFSYALPVLQEANSLTGIAGVYNRRGKVYSAMGKYSQALESFHASMKVMEKAGLGVDRAENSVDIGTVYLALGKNEKAREFLQRGLDLSLEYAAKKQIRNAYHGLYLLDSMSGNYRRAIHNMSKYILYKDSLHNEENIKELTRITMQYKFDKKQLADSLMNVQTRRLIEAKLQRQRIYTWSGLGAVLTLLFLSIYIYRGRKKIKAEKQKTDRLLLNILPEQVAEELKSSGKTEAQRYDNISVLFTDFVNFTGAAESLSPEQIVGELNACFTAFDHIIERHGLEKIKTIGDAYMAVCGLPEEADDHALRCTRAGMEIIEFMKQRSFQEQTFNIRIGIHSGSVVAGIVGVKKFAYDIWGDTVNTAARMEQNSEPGKINISEVTYKLVEDEIACVYRGEIQAKNKGMLKMFFVETTDKFSDHS